MLNTSVKSALFALAGPFMRVSGWLYRYLRAPRRGVVKVHLGPGRGNYLPGWVNVDANLLTARCDVWADLSHALPFRDNTVDAVYSHHVVEHLRDMDAHFREVFRCLKPGGIYRVGVPNADSAILKFAEGASAWFHDFPRKRASVGGRLDNFLMCSGEHHVILTFSFLEELLTSAGFEGLRKCLPIHETSAPALFGECLKLEWGTNTEAPHTLIVEAHKLGAPSPRADAAAVGTTRRRDR